MNQLPELPPKFRWAAGIIGGLLVLVVLSEWWHAYKTWAEFIELLKSSFSLPAIFIGGLLGILLSWGPTWWNRFQVRGHRAAQATALEVREIGLKAEAAELKEKAATDEKTINNLREMLTNCRKEKDESQAGFENAKDEAWRLRSVLDFGDEFPFYGKLEAADIEILVDKAWDLYPPWQQAVGAAVSAWDVIREIAIADTESLGARLWMHLDRQERARAERALHRLKEALDNKWDARKYLARLYTCYWDWRAVMHPLSMRLQATDLQKAKKQVLYSELEQAERRLQDQLDAKLQYPLLRQVKSTMDDYDQSHPLGKLGSWPKGLR